MTLSARVLVWTLHRLARTMHALFPDTRSALLRRARDDADRAAARKWCELRGLVPSAGEAPHWWQAAARAAVDSKGVCWDLLTGLPIHATRQKDGAPMVLIPGGSFLMGWSAADVDWVARNKPRFQIDITDALPQHRVILLPYYMDVHPVTRSRYGHSPRAKPRRWRRVHQADHPVTNVTWHDAAAYADGVGATLPTEAQWERAARGGQESRYPWGDEPPDRTRANFGGYFGSTTRVGCFAPNPFGLYDMAGNVYEWCQDWYWLWYYLESPVREPAGPPSGATKVLRGASYGRWADDDAALLHVAFRHAWAPDEASPYWGFRCVLPLHAPDVGC